MANNMFDEMLASIGAAISDVREKVVEEPLYGRAVTGGQDAPEQQASPAQNNAFDQALFSLTSTKDVGGPERTPEMPEPGGGMER